MVLTLQVNFAHRGYPPPGKQDPWAGDGVDGCPRSRQFRWSRADLLLLLRTVATAQIRLQLPPPKRKVRPSRPASCAGDPDDV